MPISKGREGVRALPKHPNLEHLKGEAKQRLRTLRAIDSEAKLAAAQFQIAREYGFSNWRQLKAHVEQAGGGLFGVLLINDGATPMVFVAYVLENLFGLTPSSASPIMLATHRNGKALAGVYDRREAERLAEELRALAKQHGHPFNCRVESADRIAPRSKGSIAHALAQGASAADVARMIQGQGMPADPDTAVWVKLPDDPLGFALGFVQSGRPNVTVLPDFFGFVPPGGVANLPTTSQALGPEPFAPPLGPSMSEIGKMTMAGATPLEVARALITLGALDGAGPEGDVFDLDLVSARFVRMRQLRLVVLLVNHSGRRSFRGQIIPGTEAYEAIDELPVLPRFDELDEPTLSWISL